MLKKCSTDQSFIRKRNTIYKIGTFIHNPTKTPQAPTYLLFRFVDYVISKVNLITARIKNKNKKINGLKNSIPEALIFLVATMKRPTWGANLTLKGKHRVSGL
jgi:hypothetical protein